MVYRLGVDLGTTFTAAAVCRGGVAEMVGLGNRAMQVPSVLYLKTDGGFLVGEVAQARAVREPERIAREFKRRIGDPVPILLAGSPFSAESLTARLLSWVVAVVSEREGERPESITVSHPASWSSYKIDLLRQAFRLADLADVSVCTEPAAAAVAYASRNRVEAGQRIAVYDLGGGTFDAAVLQNVNGQFALIGRPEGIEHLGGVDFDDAVFRHVLNSLGAQMQALDDDDPDTVWALERLRQDCVEAKETLSVDTETVLSISTAALHGRVRLTRGEFEDMIRPALEETLGALRRVLRSAHLDPPDLSAVVLVGGSSRIPLVSEMLSDPYGDRLAVDTHPKHDIALGAAQFDRFGIPGVVAEAAGGVTHRRSMRGRRGGTVTTPESGSPPAPELAALDTLLVDETNATAAARPPQPAGLPQRALGWLASATVALIIALVLVMIVNYDSPKATSSGAGGPGTGAPRTSAPASTSHSAPVSAAPAVGHRCSGRTCVFSLTSPVDTAAQLMWSFGDGTTKSSGTTVPHSYAHPGQYRIYLSITADGHTTRSEPVQVRLTAWPRTARLTAAGAGRLTVTISGSGQCRSGRYVLQRRTTKWVRAGAGGLRSASSTVSVSTTGVYRLVIAPTTTARGFCAGATTNTVTASRPYSSPLPSFPRPANPRPSTANPRPSTANPPPVTNAPPPPPS